MDGAKPLGLVRDGAVGVTKGKVAWIGRAADVQAGGAGKTWNIERREVDNQLRGAQSPLLSAEYRPTTQGVDGHARIGGGAQGLGRLTAGRRMDANSTKL